MTKFWFSRSVFDQMLLLHDDYQYIRMQYKLNDMRTKQRLCRIPIEVLGSSATVPPSHTTKGMQSDSRNNYLWRNSCPLVHILKEFLSSCAHPVTISLFTVNLFIVCPEWLYSTRDTRERKPFFISYHKLNQKKKVTIRPKKWVTSGQEAKYLHSPQGRWVLPPFNYYCISPPQAL